MKKLLLTATLIISSLLSQSSLAQEEIAPELYELCAKFPLNTKCKEIEVPISLKDRMGETASCQLFLGEFQKNAACKISFKDNTLIFYQEQGDKLERLEDERATVEYKIPLDRIFLTNKQIWNSIYRWEIAYLEDTEAETKNSSNNLILLTNEEFSKAIAKNLDSHTISESIDMLAQAKTNTNITADVSQLIETKECVGCNLQNADLAGVDLERANLEGANLQGANLEGANLANSYLMGANLKGANLNVAELGGAILALAQLNKAKLQATNLQATNLQGADLRQANLEKAALQAPALLQEANLQGANLSAADLRGTNFYRADLTNANLQSANLKDIKVKLQDIPGDYLTGEAALDYLVGGIFLVSSNSKVDFKTNLTEANLTGANLKEAQLEQVAVTNTNFSNADFTGAKIESTNLEEANFCGATFTEETSLSKVGC
jgi:uncharacterized protein YjbI with pentapeptide repeats